MVEQQIFDKQHKLTQKHPTVYMRPRFNRLENVGTNLGLAKSIQILRGCLKSIIFVMLNGAYSAMLAKRSRRVASRIYTRFRDSKADGMLRANASLQIVYLRLTVLVH
jgi:hypothetical protein